MAKMHEAAPYEGHLLFMPVGGRDLDPSRPLKSGSTDPPKTVMDRRVFCNYIAMLARAREYPAPSQ
jgi:hypothetical protein